MKTEDIDKKIGMPDVDEEWAKFEREVIGKSTASRKPLYWVIGIAASIALIAGIFLFGHDTEGPRQIIAQQTTPTIQVPSADKKAIEEPNESIVSLKKDVPNIVETKQRSSSDLLAQAVPPTAEETVYDCGEVMPQYPGGDRALMEFVKTNLKYPDLAMEYGARGRVIMTFLVDSCGYVSNIRPGKYLLKYDTLCMNRLPAERQVALKEQIKTLMGEEGTRILSLMPQRWTPGSMFGKNVSVRYNVHIIFNATDAERQTYLAQRDEALQGRIAGLNNVLTSADLGGDNAMRLSGVRIAGMDSVRIGGKFNDSILAVINGQPLMITGNSRQMTDNIHRYFYKHHLFVDKIMMYKDEENKRPYIEKYGEQAKNGVIVITTVPDTLCDAYVQQHPELKQIRHRVEGYVIDEETQEPLPDTWIHYFDTAGAVADSTGHFILWLPRTDVQLKVSHVGYVSSVVKTIKPKLTIRLKSATKLREVKVTPKQP